MKILCKHKTGEALSNILRKGYCTAETKFPVEVGAYYNVYAMCKSAKLGILEYIIGSDDGSEYSVPSELFAIIDNELPKGWGFNEWRNENFQAFIWGYPEILHYAHYHGLINGNSADRDIFIKRKNEIDETSWCLGEKDLLSLLLKANALPITLGALSIQKRSEYNLGMKCFFSQDFADLSINIRPSEFVSILINDIYPATASLLFDNNKLTGWDFVFDDQGRVGPWVDLKISPQIIATLR